MVIECKHKSYIKKKNLNIQVMFRVYFVIKETYYFLVIKRLQIRKCKIKIFNKEAKKV